MTVRIHDSIAYRIHRAQRVLRRHFLGMATADGLELTPEQWFVLNKLVERDGRSQVELCEAIFSDRPNLTRMLVGMEARGWVTRRGDAEDGRRNLVTLTPEGARVHHQFAARVEEQRGRIFAGISAEDLATATRVLDRIEANLGGG
ncbi:MAG: MarR family transcriptional regulator [Pseudomonadota bacterium]|nr:MarR family transcriptional regulator [Pseudomonadota bacterium]